MPFGKAKLDNFRRKLQLGLDTLGYFCCEGTRLLCLAQGFLVMLIFAFSSLAGFICLCRAYQKMQLSFFEWKESTGSAEVHDDIVAAIGVSATKNFLLYTTLPRCGPESPCTRHCWFMYVRLVLVLVSMGVEISLMIPIGDAINGVEGSFRGYCPNSHNNPYKPECPALKKLLFFAWYGAFSTIGSAGTVIPFCNLIELGHINWLCKKSRLLSVMAHSDGNDDGRLAEDAPINERLSPKNADVEIGINVV